MPMSPAERILRAQLGASRSWANTSDPTARTQPARAAAMARFEREVDPDGVLPQEERTRRARYALKAHMQSLALKSATARRKNREAVAADDTAA